MMKILSVLYNRGLGGVEQAFLDGLLGFRTFGHEVMALVPPDAAIIPKLKEAALPFQTSPWVGKPWGRHLPWVVRRLKRQIGEYSPDMVVAHNARTLPLLRQCWQGRIIAISHGSTRGFEAADQVVAVNSSLAEELRKTHPKVFVIPNMNSYHGYGKWRGLPPVIGAMARFTPEKGMDLLVEALAILHQRGVEFTAILGGDGATKPALMAACARAGIGDRIEFCGWVEDKQGFYSRLSIFCLPSRHEAFGLVLVEAACHGLAMVASNVDGPRELLQDGITGLLVEAGNAKALADGLERMIRDQTLAEALGEAALRSLPERYGEKAIMRMWEDVIDL